MSHIIGCLIVVEFAKESSMERRTFPKWADSKHWRNREVCVFSPWSRPLSNWSHQATPYIYDNTLQRISPCESWRPPNRDVWQRCVQFQLSFVHVHIQRLFQDKLIRAEAYNIQILDSSHLSAFIICLDSSEPKDPSRALWHGDVVAGIPVGLRNRWVDKPLQFIVFDNAYAGFMGEHSVMDGTPTTRMYDMLDMLYDPAFDHDTSYGEPVPLPQPLDWEISPEITQAINYAGNAACELMESQELGFHLTSYGKAAIKTFGVSASIRKFYKGRTCCQRRSWPLGEHHGRWPSQ